MAAANRTTITIQIQNTGVELSIVNSSEALRSGVNGPRLDPELT